MTSVCLSQKTKLTLSLQKTNPLFYLSISAGFLFFIFFFSDSEPHEKYHQVDIYLYMALMWNTSVLITFLRLNILNLAEKRNFCTLNVGFSIPISFISIWVLINIDQKKYLVFKIFAGMIFCQWSLLIHNCSKPFCSWNMLLYLQLALYLH